MGCKIIRVPSKSAAARPVSARGLRQRGRDGGTEEEPERVTLPRAGADGSPWRASTGSCQAHAECGSRNAVSKRRLLQAAERANHALRAMQVQGRRLLLQGLPGLPIRTAARVRCMHIPLAPRSESLSRFACVCRKRRGSSGINFRACQLHWQARRVTRNRLQSTLPGVWSRRGARIRPQAGADGMRP